MPSEAYVGRVGGLVVALVVGVAILTGWDSGVAWADEPGGTAGTSASSTGSEAQKAPGATSSEARSSATSTATSNEYHRLEDETRRGAFGPGQGSPSVRVAATGGDRHDGPAAQYCRTVGNRHHRGQGQQTRHKEEIRPGRSAAHDDEGPVSATVGRRARIATVAALRDTRRPPRPSTPTSSQVRPSRPAPRRCG